MLIKGDALPFLTVIHCMLVGKSRARTLCAHPLIKFNASHFCEIMQRLHGNIMFLGDSIQHEFAPEFTSDLHIELGNRNQTMGCRTCYNLCNAADMHPQYCLKDAHSYVNYFNLSIDRNDYLLIPSNTQTNNFTHKSHWRQTIFCS
jgi:hypothetical protein